LSQHNFVILNAAILGFLPQYIQESD